MAIRTTQIMIHLFDDPSKVGDPTIIKSVALDWLGNIGAHVVGTIANWKQFQQISGLLNIPGDDISVEDGQRLCTLQSNVCEWLQSVYHDDTVALKSMLGFNLAKWTIGTSKSESFCRLVIAAHSSLITGSLKSLINTNAVGAPLQEALVCDSTLLLSSNIRRVIADRLIDSSASVRDAAVDLLGKYVLQAGQAAVTEYYPDVSPNVRKRILRLLREIYLALMETVVDCQSDVTIIADIAGKILGRLHDDAAVSDLAFKILFELWLQSPKDTENSQMDWLSLPETLKLAFRIRASILTAVVTKSTAQSSLFGDLLARAAKAAEKSETSAKPRLSSQINGMILCLVDQLLTLYEASRMDEVAANLLLLQRLSSIAPDLVSPHLFTLHPFIHSSKASDNPIEIQRDQQVQQNVLGIFQNVLPLTKNADPVLVQRVEADLLQLLNKSSQQVAVPCICTIIANHTRNFAKLARIVITCYTYLLPELEAISKGNGLVMQSFTILNCFIDSVNTPDTNLVALTCLGNLILSDAKLLVREETMRLFARMFAHKSGGVKEKRQVVSIIAQYLETQQTIKTEDDVLIGAESQKRHGKQQENAFAKPIDMKVLVGNSEQFAETGIASAVVQRFLDDILSCMLSSDSTLSSNAFQVTTLIIDQGLVHPLLIVPALSAIVSSDDTTMSSRAYAMHSMLAEKHASFIHNKNIEAVRSIFDYHASRPQNANIGLIPGFVAVATQTETESSVHIESRIAKLYGILRQVRMRRSEFLRGVVRYFEIDDSIATIDHVRFLLFVADCLVHLDYKTIDEVLLVVSCLMRILSTSGEAALVQANRLAANPCKHASEMEGATLRALSAGAVLLVKHQLQQAYALTDA
eukprot:jgi/Hompol1/6624/HPOL_002289-RA